MDIEANSSLIAVHESKHKFPIQDLFPSSQHIGSGDERRECQVFLFCELELFIGRWKESSVMRRQDPRYINHLI